MSSTTELLQDRLDSVARTMRVSPGYTEAEVAVWRFLARNVDAARFERTGQIISEIGPMEAVAGDADETTTVDAAAAEEALELLKSKGHLAVVQQEGETVRYRLILHAPAS